MSTKQWVQHISGTGEKWEVIEESEWEFEVRSTKPRVSVGAHYLPKSEYRLCEPPEVWEDVTEGVTEKDTQNVCWWYWEHGKEDALAVHISKGYRLRKVQLGELITDSFSHEKWAFIVEKKVSQ